MGRYLTLTNKVGKVKIPNGVSAKETGKVFSALTSTKCERRKTEPKDFPLTDGCSRRKDLKKFECSLSGILSSSVPKALLNKTYKGHISDEIDCSLSHQY